MSDPRKILADLMRRIGDAATTEAEAEAASAALVKQIRRLAHDRDTIHSIADTVEGVSRNASPNHLSSADQDAYEMIGFTRGWAAAIEVCQDAANAARGAIAEATVGMPYGLGLGVETTLNAAVEVGFEALQARKPIMSVRFQKSLDYLAKAAKGLRSPVNEKDARQRELHGVIHQLFAKEVEQPGADTIARKLNRRASDVRAALKEMIEWGEVEAVGKGRARRYRAINTAN